jgi:hypothetical protein
MTMPFRKPAWGRGIFPCAPSSLQSSANTDRAQQQQRSTSSRGEMHQIMCKAWGFGISWLLCSHGEHACRLGLWALTGCHTGCYSISQHMCSTLAAYITLSE